MGRCNVNWPSLFWNFFLWNHWGHSRTTTLGSNMSLYSSHHSSIKNAKWNMSFFLFHLAYCCHHLFTNILHASCTFSMKLCNLFVFMLYPKQEAGWIFSESNGSLGLVMKQTHKLQQQHSKMFCAAFTITLFVNIPKPHEMSHCLLTWVIVKRSSVRIRLNIGNG